jgi:hypothetical protein
MLFNVSGLAPLETVETEGPGAPAARSRPAPAWTERVHDAGAGHDAGGCLPGPSHFSRVAHLLRESNRNESFPPNDGHYLGGISAEADRFVPGAKSSTNDTNSDTSAD